MTWRGLLTAFMFVSSICAAKAQPAPVFNWSGYYAGVHIGYGGGDSRWTSRPVDVEFSTEGMIGGVTVGRNWQMSDVSVVLGLEADVSAAKVSGISYLPCSATGCTPELQVLSTFRGRFGVVRNRTLFYGTGGLAIGVFNYVSPAAPMDIVRGEVGWTVGAGIESLLGRNWSWKAEYLYIEFGQSNLLFVSNRVYSDFNATHIGRFGVNYRW